MAEDGVMTDRDRLQILRYSIGLIDEDSWGMFKTRHKVGPRYHDTNKIALYLSQHGHLLPEIERNGARATIARWKNDVREYRTKNPPTTEIKTEKRTLR